MINPKTLAQTYRCTQNAPLSCQKPTETIHNIPGAKFCLECGFPTTLPDQVELRGSLGTYRITSLLRSQGMGRLYNGTQIRTGKPIVVKEYLLPNRCFNAAEAHRRRTALLQATQAGLNTPKVQEFRWICPSEVIADPSSDRIFLIFPNCLAATPTLNQVLKETGAFSATLVRQVLNQVLQTLHFLHSRTIGADASHGNLSLESLLMREDSYTYICDLGAWEHLFVPLPKQQVLPAQDLVDLGWVAFSLWTGHTTHSETDSSVNPREADHWPQNDPPLKEFVLRLLGLEMPFESAMEARQVLLQLPQPDYSETGLARHRSQDTPTKRKFHKYWLLSLLACPILGALLWLLLPRFMSKSYAEINAFKHLLPSFSDVNDIQPGNYPYTGEALGTWTTVLNKQPINDRKVRDLLNQPQPDIAARFGYRSYAPKRSPLAEVLSANRKANFAITSLATTLPEGLVQETVAYDGLLVYIPAYKSQDLPSLLQGKISLTQLREIFTGKVTRWKQLGENYPDLPITPYRPMEPEALHLFQAKVLANDPHLIAQFQTVKQRSTFSTLRAIAAGEQKGQTTEAGSISFGLLTQTWDQCKVYPLAIASENTAPVQPLLRETANGTAQPISPSDNLCLEKQPLPNLSAFLMAQYPLSAPLVVAYPRDNNLPGYRSGPLFANLLKTQEGQYLLQQAGLVPLQPIPKNHKSSLSTPNR